MSLDALVKARVVRLLQQMEAEGKYGWQTKLARHVWNDTEKQSHVHQLLKGKKAASLKTASELAKGLNLSMRFFTDASLGTEPDYHAWIGVSDAAESVVDRTQSDIFPQDWTDQARAFLAAERPLLTAEQEAEFWRVRRSIGAATGTATLSGLVSDVRRRIPDRTVADPSRAQPDDGHVDVLGDIAKRRG